MATKKVKVWTEQEVEVCKRCGQYRPPMGQLTVNAKPLDDTLEPLALYDGVTCATCVQIVKNATAKRKVARRKKALEGSTDAAE